MTIRIDPATASQIHLILARSRVRGTDPVAALDAAGLLSYPAKLKQEEDQVLRQVIQTLFAATPTMLGGGTVPATAADMKRCILETIERMRD